VVHHTATTAAAAVVEDDEDDLTGAAAAVLSPPPAAALSQLALPLPSNLMEMKESNWSTRRSVAYLILIFPQKQKKVDLTYYHQGLRRRSKLLLHWRGGGVASPGAGGAKRKDLGEGDDAAGPATARRLQATAASRISWDGEEAVLEAVGADSDHWFPAGVEGAVGAAVLHYSRAPTACIGVQLLNRSSN
jgi:hypothetical protein